MQDRLDRLLKWFIFFSDSKGLPRCITNSRGKKRRPNSKGLISAVRSNDPNFIKFLSRCLEYVHCFIK